MSDLITLPRATVRQALEAWEYINKYGFVLADYEGPMEQAITALRAALEQPVQAVPVRAESVTTPPCKGMNCGAIDGRSHSLECHAEHSAAIAGGRFVPLAQTAALEQPEQEPLKPNATTRLQDPGAYDRGVLTGLRQALAICSDLEDFTADRLARDIQDAINNQMALEQPNECHWYQDGDEDSGTYMASCNRRYFMFEDGTPTDNRMSHCCYCGKPLVEVPIEPEDNHD